MDDVMFSHNDREQATRNRRILKVTQQGTAGFDTATNTETDPPWAANWGRSLMFTIAWFRFYTDAAAGWSSIVVLPSSAAAAAVVLLLFVFITVTVTTRRRSSGIRFLVTAHLNVCIWFSLQLHIGYAYFKRRCLFEISKLISVSTIRYDTIRDASLACARKPTRVSLIYRTIFYN